MAKKFRDLTRKSATSRTLTPEQYFALVAVQHRYQAVLAEAQAAVLLAHSRLQQVMESFGLKMDVTYDINADTREVTERPAQPLTA